MGEIFNLKNYKISYTFKFKSYCCDLFLIIATYEGKHSFNEQLTEEHFKTEKPTSLQLPHIIHTLTQFLLSSSLRHIKTLDFKDPKPQIQISLMAKPQNLVPNLSQIMEEYTANEEEVHLEPQTEKTPVLEPKVQGEEQNPAQKGRKQKRTEQARTEQARAEQTEESEDDKAFILYEAYSL